MASGEETNIRAGRGVTFVRAVPKGLDSFFGELVVRYTTSVSNGVAQHEFVILWNFCIFLRVSSVAPASFPGGCRLAPAL